MVIKSILERGFKAKAERMAVDYRSKLNLKVWEPLCAFKLANYLEIGVYDATNFLSDLNEIAKLSAKGNEDCGWSALTMKTKAENTIIIHNPFHSPSRQQSNIMHELAHIICKHAINDLVENLFLPIGMRHYNKLQEEEAVFLGSTLQITKPSLMWALKRNMTTQEIAYHFNASADMVAYRMRLSGAAKQYYYMKRA